MTRPTRPTTSFALALLVLFAAACTAPAAGGAGEADQESAEMEEHYEVTKSEQEWKQELSAEEFHILREQGTERAFSGDLWDHHEEGVYVCAACGQELFDSKTKFDSGTGWPSYYEPIAEEAVGTETDRSYGMRRTEVHCSRCGGHLGHIFPDGPQPTGLRYCINSASLDFEPRGD
ncbi:MAG TPA: peptide-methionine (R)-S-oxide reductase MsrB [Thermoanaerobaculia bacterium]|nr:peptide-methionine (R)-S-oxide reductase MsrB [Thermoanaerobaculia bacterium]